MPILATVFPQKQHTGEMYCQDLGPQQNSPHKVLLTDHIYPILKEVVSCRMTRLTTIGHRASPNGLMSMEINRSHPNWMPMGDFGLMFQTTLSLPPSFYKNSVDVYSKERMENQCKCKLKLCWQHAQAQNQF